jgi:hypothetical protein
MKKLILHVGAPKCGSSALQSTLEVKERNGDLNKIGFTFPLEFSSAIGRNNSGPLLDVFVTRKNNDEKIVLTRCLDFLYRQEKNIIISDERLFWVIDRNKLNKFYTEINSKFQELIIVTAIRETGSWLLSDYSQHIKQNVSNVSFPEHVVQKERNCDWLSYFARLIGHGNNFQLVACDYKNLFNCIAEVLGVEGDFLSVSDENLNVNFSLTSAQLEAKIICNILGIKEPAKIKKLQTVYQDFNLKEENKSLLKYIDKKNEGYVEKIKSLKDVFFYEC